MSDPDTLNLDATSLKFIRHELRTPINHILGYSEMLLEDANEREDSATAEDLQKIHKAARNLLTLISIHLSPEKPGEKPAAPPPDPAAKPIILPSYEKKARSLELDSGTILIVEDNEANRDVLARQLEKQGYTVKGAEDGHCALELLSREAFDLILLDILMPGMNGIEVLEHLKEDPQLRHIPIIMISALDEMESVVHCIEMGAEDYLPKPFDPVLLRARIGASLEKKRFHDAEQHYLKTIMETQDMLNSELNEAADYVRSLLPEPLAGSISTTWEYIPSTQLGGDAFGYHWLDDEHFVMYLLDVCGHGVGAALLSISIMNVLRSGSLSGANPLNPGAVLSALNERFLMSAQHDKYFTIWYGVFNRLTRRLVFGSGGHPPAVLLNGPSEKDMTAHKLKAPGAPIGWDIDNVYDNVSFQCDAFARLYIFSDGTYELEKPGGDMHTHEEFTRVLAAPGDGSEPAMERIVRYSRDIQGSDSFEDDFSLLEITFS